MAHHVVYENPTKTKLFASSDWQNLEHAINDFIKDKVVIDIKFQSLYLEPESTINDRVLIMYEERV